MDGCPDDLELIVSDNASLDETHTVVLGFIQKGFPIRYVANEANIGPDRNIDACFHLASGRYVWVIGDDDILYRGTARYVLEVCRAQQFGVLHLSSRGFYQGQQGLVISLAKPDVVAIQKLGASKFFRAANVRLTFISANVVNKEAILRNNQNFKDEIESLHNSNMNHLAWIYSAIKVEQDHYLVQTPLFGALGGNSGGYDLVQVFGVNLARITKQYFNKTFPEAVHIIENAVVTMLLPAELIRQSRNPAQKNKFTNENIIEAATKVFNANLYFKYCVRPIFSGPALFRTIGFFVLRVFNKINKVLNFSLL